MRFCATGLTFPLMILCQHVFSFQLVNFSCDHARRQVGLDAKGFGASPSSSPKNNKNNKSNTGKSRSRLINSLEEDGSSGNSKSQNLPYVKSQQEELLASLQAKASNSCLGRAIASGPFHNTPDADPFWELIPSLIQSRFPKVADHELERVAGFLRHMVNPNLKKEGEKDDSFRPLEDIHAYMPGLGATQPFHDPNCLEFCKQLSKNYETILQEYHALLADMEKSGKDRFQSVTSMNYESGWKTMVLFYNGHRIEGFPYHLCPVTTNLLETMPIAGRIAGFNRQRPQSGIPRHTDGNNMWLTCQMGLLIPEDNQAYITVADSTRYWKNGECLLYDTTYWHETFNRHPTQERVVLHVDFFNTLAMTKTEIQVLQYIYSLREQFMKAEGVVKVGAQIL